jgi:hypothetical protein
VACIPMTGETYQWNWKRPTRTARGWDQRRARHRGRATITSGHGDFQRPSRLGHATRLGHSQLPKSAQEVLMVADLVLDHL